jgi:D-glycerate 3-kinase
MHEYSRSEFAKHYGLTKHKRLSDFLSDEFASWIDELKLPESLVSDLRFIYLPLCKYLYHLNFQSPERTSFIGISGSQGSGKTTFAHLFGMVLKHFFHHKVVNCSIDDFYLTRAEREKLSREVHPLLKTRGVPGTHDVELALETFNSLIRATDETVTPIPVFDKAIDDRKPKDEWLYFQGRPTIILFEGWCVGAKAVADAELLIPVNELERNYDQDGTFRKYANDALKSGYAQWFAMMDQLFMLRVPGFEQVMEWRWIQEQKLAEKHSGELSNKLIMNKAETQFFISHFERITRQMLDEMPQSAHVVFGINKSQAIKRIRIN